ncbi:MAG: isopeptide-forming domain-containing fimbrial protein, partial [Lachnoclostridium sp.]|nr:isopeptide-forming domain-containing fimbrial protein [Lachnoclostridium sp.]
MKQKGHIRKKLAALTACIMLAAAVCAALPLTARATSTEQSSIDDAGKGSITVSNPKDGVTYYGYKIFDVTYRTLGGTTSYSYSLSGTSDWYTIVKNYADTAGNGLILTKAAGADEYVVSIEESAFSAAGFANHLKANVGSISANFSMGPAGESQTSLTAQNLALGYYFVLSKNGEATQALCNLTTTTPDATISDKNDTPFEKEISAIDTETFTGDDPVTGKDVQVGQTITYTITGKVPDTSGAATYIYRAADTMQKGLTFQKDVTVKIGTQTVTLTETTESGTLTGNKIRYTDPVAGTSGGGFNLSLDLLEKSGDNYKYASGDDITITYTAKVNKDAVNVISENEAKLEYGTDPDSLAESTPQIVRTLSSSVIVDKYKKVQDETDMSAKLPGAKFVLKRNTGNDAEYYKGTFSGTDANTDPANLTNIEWVKSADAADGTPTVPDLTTSGITVVTTDNNGAASFAGLANGTYYLIEVEAPAGYNLLKDPETVVINAVIDTTTGSIMTGDGYTTQEVIAHVANSDGTFLPATGGMGTTLF